MSWTYHELINLFYERQVRIISHLSWPLQAARFVRLLFLSWSIDTLSPDGFDQSDELDPLLERHWKDSKHGRENDRISYRQIDSQATRPCTQDEHEDIRSWGRSKYHDEKMFKHLLSLPIHNHVTSIFNFRWPVQTEIFVLTINWIFFHEIHHTSHLEIYENSMVTSFELMQEMI